MIPLSVQVALEGRVLEGKYTVVDPLTVGERGGRNYEVEQKALFHFSGREK